jgi:four helix bundle protein
MAIYGYGDLEVYREGFALAVRLHRRTEGFPEAERYGIVSQIRRSSKSVCALIAEGFGRKESSAEFRRYLRMAHGSVQETKVWLEFSQTLGYLGDQEGRDLWQEYDRLGRRLYSLLEKWQ